MPTRTIPSEEWSDFLNAFTREQKSKVVTVRVSDPELGYQVEMRQLPLLGVTPDLRSGGGPRVEVIVGRTDFEHTTHSVSQPTAIRLLEDDQARRKCLSWRERTAARPSSS